MTLLAFLIFLLASFGLGLDSDLDKLVAENFSFLDE
jgi:hypothetical protein